MDDIPPTLPTNCRASFSSLGEAHGRLLSRLRTDLRKRCPRLSLWFCPTVYTDECAPEGILESSYLADLSLTIPSDVLVLWTGPAVIADKLDKASLLPVSRLFNGNVVVWDNLYANDYCPYRLFLGPYGGRNRDLALVTKGVLLNPTGMPHTDAFLLSLLSAFTRAVPHERAWRDAMRKLPFAKEFSLVAGFFGSPFDRVYAGGIAGPALRRYRLALHRLVWEWKSPLQREWYPYLYMLDTNLRLLEKPDNSAGNIAWINKKYPAVLSAILSRRAPAGKRVRS
jgi:protein O-GlcNAcase/histone acetyltransferase